MGENKRRKIGYCRVSTDEQETALQADALAVVGCEQVFTDEGKTGRTFSRPALQLLFSELQQGDTLVVWKLDRLGRSVIDLMQLLSKLQSQGVEFVSLTEFRGHDTQYDTVGFPSWKLGEWNRYA